MTAPPPTPDFFIVGVSETQITSYVWVSGLTVIIYDTISTLPREVGSIPSSQVLSLLLGLGNLHLERKMVPSNDIIPIATILGAHSGHVKYDCLFNRSNFDKHILYPGMYTEYPGYVSDATYFSDLLCPCNGSNPFLLNIVNGILGLRLYALYGRNTHILSFLSLLFAGEFACQTYIGVKIGIATVSATFIAPPGVRILGCLTAPPELSGITIMWIVSIGVTVICFIMTLAQFIHSAREARQAGSTYRFTPLAAAFIKDGTVYFLAVVVTLTGGAITGSLVSGPFTILYEPWMAISLILAGSRLVLNLRMAAACDFSSTRIPSSIRGLESSNGIEFYNK
ncbi:hypothetical protein GALMADRAFT_146267 [Galerina marginata CBS 339.88]|uniref:Uncharacterized protein n=1 Tax=Galerina marginata (strain CBS 339.88) TaxID=685588 RepID=A0A067SLN5_GALM3|nr:hypothetical protein GALMADRAFT_146267 [Galerina marginata CBS 339.88]